MLKAVAVKGLIVENDKYLLAMHNIYDPRFEGTWTFLGGHIEPTDQSPEDTLRRELWEEIKVTVEVHHTIGVYPYFNRGYLVVSATITGDPIPDPSEILELRWYTREEIRRMAEENLLQTGFEEAAIDRYLQMCA